jgi:secreted PhoX family phosphatase
MIHDDDISNESANQTFTEVLSGFQQRRSILQGGIAAASAFFTSAPAMAGTIIEHLDARSGRDALVDFTPVPLAGAGGLDVRLSADYSYSTLIPWGSPLYPGSSDTIGIGHDGMAYFPVSRSSMHGLLTINHEYGDNSIVIGKNVPDSLEDVRDSQYAHGISVVEIMNTGTNWEAVNTLGVARRIHGNTPVEFSGPAANSPLLQNAANNAFLGTLNNCANGETPWGTYLTCEENFNGYFGAKNASAWTRSSMQARYGFSATGFGYGWHLFDDRFDLSNPDYAREGNRYGWVVEIDPRNPNAKAVKRTALGRMKHEGAAVVVGRGRRVVAYMGDDERFEYIYKFVSSDNYRSMLARGQSPLDHGTLYVARFNADGTGDWLELSLNNPAIAAEFSSMDQVLVYTRRAADLAGATKMDRPEWTTVAPNGIVYCTLTNNTARTDAQVDAANPIARNRSGHIIRWMDSQNYTGLNFIWDILVKAQDTHGTEASFASPDGLWADPDGRLFIQTDGSQADGLNDQMLVHDIRTGTTKRLLEGVSGCEVTGIAVTPDRKTMFCNLQHPDPDTSVGRDLTLVITRNNGGVIGS